jgi:preprotein translocase subunit SecG
MKNPKLIESIICLLVVVLAVAIFVLVMLSPGSFLEARAVYKGF